MNETFTLQTVRPLVFYNRVDPDTKKECGPVGTLPAGTPVRVIPNRVHGQQVLLQTPQGLVVWAWPHLVQPTKPPTKDRCDQCGKFVPLGQLYVVDDDTGLSRCKHCENEVLAEIAPAGE